MLTAEQEITVAKIRNLGEAIVEILNSDIDNSPEGEFDPYDHITALSMVLCSAAVMLGMSKEDFVHGVSNTYDRTVESKDMGARYVND